jgi:DDE superfamily endonuclease
MDDARELWSWWQSLLTPFQSNFTLGGWARFAQWVTGTVLCPEEHTITQILTGLGLESQWRNVEHFAEYGSWDRQAVERQLMRLIEREHPARWGGYHPVAVDDTKEHRTSAEVWGTCTFHESGARCPNRATTVRAHNWVGMGDLVPGKPWSYLPVAARLYFRKNQLPVGESFRTKTDWAVDMLRQADAESKAPILAVFDGAYAMETVIGPCLNPPPGGRRIEFVTRLRRDARLYQPLREELKKPQGGRPRIWGRRLPAPQEHAKWNVRWQSVCLRPHPQLSLQMLALLLVGERTAAARLGLRVRRARLRQIVVDHHQRRRLVGRSSPGRQRRTLSSGGWVSRSQAATGHGRMSRVDQGTNLAHVSGPDAGADVAATGAVPTGRSPRRSMAPRAAVEPAQAACLDSRSTTIVLETPGEVFATRGCHGRLAKTSTNQIHPRPANGAGCVKC